MRGPPAEAGGCEELGRDSAAAEGVWRLRRFSPVPTTFALELGYKRRVVQARRPKGADRARAPDSCIPGSGTLGPSGERARAPVLEGEDAKARVRSAGLAPAGLDKGGTPTPRFSPWLALERPETSLSQGLTRDTVGKALKNLVTKLDNCLQDACVGTVCLFPFQCPVLFIYFLNARETAGKSEYV